MPDPAHSLTVGPRGPIVLDQQFFDMHQVSAALAMPREGLCQE